MRGRLKSAKGYSAMDATVGIMIVAISVSLVAAMIYNIYLQILATHKNSMATYYAVQILERVEMLDYNSTHLSGASVGKSGSSIIGVPIEDGYTPTIQIEKYSDTHTGAEDLIKKITVRVEYNENDLTKNIQISTLKLNL